MGQPNTFEAESGTIDLDKVVAVEPEEPTDAEHPLEEQEKVSVLLASGKRVEVEGEDVPELLEAIDDYLEQS